MGRLTLQTEVQFSELLNQVPPNTIWVKTENKNGKRSVSRLVICHVGDHAQLPTNFPCNMPECFACVTAIALTQSYEEELKTTGHWGKKKKAIRK